MKKILIVEDVDYNLDLMVQLLEENYQLLTARDGITGLRLAESEAPDLILMDLSLPLLDGWDAARQLKEDVRLGHIPVIAFSAHAMNGDRAKALEAGCDDYLSKPVDETLLFALIKRFLKE